MVREMENKTAVAKKTLTLTCHVSGFPIDHISWSKGGWWTLQLDNTDFTFVLALRKEFTVKLEIEV